MNTGVDGFVHSGNCKTVNERRFKAYGVVGIVVFVSAAVLMRQGREPFVTYFYCFAWWSYIMVADAWVYRLEGASLVSTHPRRFVTMIPLSVFVWSLFEAFNFRLDNWHYINVPQETWRRWLGYALAYGTVLPGLCVTTHLVRAMRVRRRLAVESIRLSAPVRSVIMGVGVACLVSTLLIPRYAFPLLWLGGALALDPVNYRWGLPSLSRDLESGDVHRVLDLLTAGLICGFLWEFWNFWAQVKWIYTVPFFEWGKLFEMPIAGYLGFPLFAVTAFSTYHGLVCCVERRSSVSRIAFWIVVVGVCGSVFYGIDRFTVVSYVPRIIDFPEIESSVSDTLENEGVRTAFDIMRLGHEGLLELGVEKDTAGQICQVAGVVALKGMGIEHYRLLRRADVTTLSDLAAQNPEVLMKAIEGADEKAKTAGSTLHPAIVRMWIEEARRRSACNTER